MTAAESPDERYDRIVAEHAARHNRAMDLLRETHQTGPVRVADRAVGMPPRPRKDQT